MREKIFENVETSLYRTGFVSRTVWNTNNDRHSYFGHVYEKKVSDFGHFYRHFLILINFFLNVKRSVYRDVLLFFKNGPQIAPSQYFGGWCWILPIFRHVEYRSVPVYSN